jgi:hypothetical protein
LKRDVGKLGRSYLVVLWLGMTVLLLVGFLVGIGRMAFRGYSGPDVIAFWRTSAVILVAALVHGATAWGVVLRRRWSYYLSLAFAVYWISLSGYHLVNGERLTLAPLWFNAIFFVPCVVALGWLVSPALRSQFSPAMRKS